MLRHMAMCQYKPELCLMADQHNYVRHLRHHRVIMDLGSINYLLVLILVVSLAMKLSQRLVTLLKIPKLVYLFFSFFQFTTDEASVS